MPATSNETKSRVSRFSLEGFKQRCAAGAVKVAEVSKSAKQQIRQTTSRQEKQQWATKWKEWAQEVRSLEEQGDGFSEDEFLVERESSSSSTQEQQLWEDVRLVRRAQPSPAVLEFCRELGRMALLAVEGYHQDVAQLQEETREAHRLLRRITCDQDVGAVDLSEEEEDFLEGDEGERPSGSPMGSPTSSGGGNGDGSSSCKMMIDHDHDDEHVEDGLHSAASARHDGITTAVGGGDFSGNELTNDHSQTCSVVSALQERSGCRPRAGSFSKRSSLPCEKQQQDQVTRVKQSYMAQLTALTNEYRATVTAKNSEVAQIECELALLTDEQPKSAVGDDEGASAASSRPPSSGGARRRAGSISSTTTTQKGGTRTSVGRLGVHRDRLMEKRRYIREQLSIAYRDWRKGRRTLLDKAKKDTQLAEARRFAQFEHEVDSLRRQVNAIHVRSKKMTKTMSRGRRGGEQGQCETTDTCATEEVSTFFAKELPQKVREWEQEGAAKLQRLEQKIAAHDRRREQERTNVEVQREQEMRELVAYRRENAVHAARKRLRDQMEAAKAAERARLREQQQEQEEEAARRMERTLEKLKVAAPEDPERLFRMCTSGVPRYFDPKGTICRNQVADVHGYFEERLQRDPRYRLSAALHKADMIQSDAARSALQSVRPVLAKNHALNSAVPGMPLGV